MHDLKPMDKEKDLIKQVLLYITYLNHLNNISLMLYIIYFYM